MWLYTVLEMCYESLKAFPMVDGDTHGKEELGFLQLWDTMSDGLSGEYQALSVLMPPEEYERLKTSPDMECQMIKGESNMGIIGMLLCYALCIVCVVLYVCCDSNTFLCKRCNGYTTRHRYVGDVFQVPTSSFDADDFYCRRSVQAWRSWE